MTIVSYYMPDLSGYLSVPGRTLTLKLTKSSDFSAVNGAGDALAENGSSGWFSATVDEPWTETLGVSVVTQSGLVPHYGSLGKGETIVSDVVMGKVVVANEDVSLLVSTTISAITSQTVFRLAAGSADNSAYVGQMAVITDATNAVQKSVVMITAYSGTTVREVTLESAPRFVIAVGDKVNVIAVGSQSAGGGSNAGVTLVLGATIPLNVGSVTGLNQELVVGDTYTAEVGRRIPVTLTDIYGNAVATTFGNKSLSDNNCTIKCLLHPENSRNSGSVKAFVTVICEFVAAVGQTPAMLWVSLPQDVTAKFTPGAYRVHFRAEWTTGESVTLAWEGSATFVRRLITN
jgi:hypothetical protein